MGKFRYVTFGKCYVTAKSFFHVANIFSERIFAKDRKLKTLAVDEVSGFRCQVSGNRP